MLSDFIYHWLNKIIEIDELYINVNFGEKEQSNISRIDTDYFK